MKNGTQGGIRTGKDNGVLWQPLQRSLIVEPEVLIETGLRAAAAIELARAGHGDQRMAFRVQMHRNIQRIAADYPAWRVQQIQVAGVAFGIKRPLYGEGPEVMSSVQEGFLRV